PVEPHGSDAGTREPPAVPATRDSTRRSDAPTGWLGASPYCGRWMHETASGQHLAEPRREPLGVTGVASALARSEPRVVAGEVGDGQTQLGGDGSAGPGRDLIVGLDPDGDARRL